MKTTITSKENKTAAALRQAQEPKFWPIVIAIAIFAVISWVYFYPVMQGKRVKQHDMEMHKGMAQELTQYRALDQLGLQRHARMEHLGTTKDQPLPICP